VREARQRGFDWQAFTASLAHLHWGWLAAGVFFSQATYLGRALRWAVLIAPLRPKASLAKLVSATVIGFAALSVFGRPGEFVRPYLIATGENVPFSSQLGAWLLERIFDLLAALLIFGFALSQVQGSDIRVGPGLAWVLQAGGWFGALMSLACVAILVVIRRHTETARARLLGALRFLPEVRYRKAVDLVDALMQGVESVRGRQAMLWLVFYTAMEWAIIVACIYCIAMAYGGALAFGLIDVLILLGFLSFGAVVHIPGVGGGIQLVTIMVLTELFRVPLEVAASVSIVIWITTSIVVVPFGVLLAFREGLNWARLRGIERQAAR
jgi:glycosyltransferase 2 family protein